MHILNQDSCQKSYGKISLNWVSSSQQGHEHLSTLVIAAVPVQQENVQPLYNVVHIPTSRFKNKKSKKREPGIDMNRLKGKLVISHDCNQGDDYTACCVPDIKIAGNRTGSIRAYHGSGAMDDSQNTVPSSCDVLLLLSSTHPIFLTSCTSSQGKA